MASHFLLELDTTKPTIDVYVQNRVSKNALLFLVIEADEPLLNFQDIYIMDSQSTCHPLILSFLNASTLYGEIVLNQMAPGIATLFVRLKDIVLNESILFMKTFELTEQAAFSIYLNSMVSHGIKLDESARVVRVLDQGKKAEIGESKLSLCTDSKSMKLKVYEQFRG